MTEARSFLVSRAERGAPRGRLGEVGINSANRATQVLLGKELGQDALLLSSDLPRAVHTATIIGEGLGLPVHTTERLSIAGYDPGVVGDLDVYLEETLETLRMARNPGQSLVVVTHAPLIAVAKGLRPSDIEKVGYGEVVEYTAGSWDNSAFSSNTQRTLPEFTGLL